MNEMLEIFKNEIITNTRGRIREVKIVPRIRGLVGARNGGQSSPASSPTEAQIAAAQRRHPWVSTMDDFRDSMMSIHNTLKGLRMDMEPYRIKVSPEFPH